MQISNSEKQDSLKALFTIDMSLQSQDFHSEWQRCSLLANYISEYVAYQFTERGRAENIISTVANELLEAVTYLTPKESSMSISCSQFTDVIRFDMEFLVRSEALSAYMGFMKNYAEAGNGYLELLTGDTIPDEHFNQLGLTMLAHDFNIKIDTRLDDRINSVHSQVFIPIEEFLK